MKKIIIIGTAIIATAVASAVILKNKKKEVAETKETTVENETNETVTETTENTTENK